MDENQIRKMLERERAKEKQHREKAEKLLAMLDNSVTANWPKEQVKRLESGLCLKCGTPLNHHSDKILRGNHSACYYRTDRLIRSGEITKEDAERTLGLYAPEKKSGRKRKEDQPPASIQIAAEKKATYRKTKSIQSSRIQTDRPLNGASN